MLPDTALGDVAVSNPITILVPLGAVVVATVLYGERRRLGPAADWVEVIRSVALPVFDPLIERYVGGAGSAYELSEAEYVGRIHESPEIVEQLLWNHGYRRNTLSAFKTTPDDREQIGAWVYRGDQVADDRQVDAMLFRAPKGERGTDVYAHEEYSSALRWLLKDPAVLSKHYDADEYDPESGIEHVVGQLWAECPMTLSDRAEELLADGA